MSPAEVNKKTVSRAKKSNKLYFYIIGSLIPIIFFLLLEIILRLVGFGQSTPVFIDNPVHADYQLARPDLMKRYFPFSKHPPQVTMETDFFLSEKPKNGFRVFVQGGSTAAGFPYGLGASLAGTLEQRLRQSMPNKHVEVINTAMSAVNTHTLLDIADEVIEQEPDMILIYAGHNEFLGIMGASSNFATSNSYWLTRTMLSLKNVRLVQLFQWLYAQFEADQKQTKPSGNEAKEPVTSSARTMMAQVAENQGIEFNSDVYKAGLHQFRENLEKLISKYQQAGIPVYISTLASNYKDQAPFSTKEVEQAFESLVAKLSAGNLSSSDKQNIAKTLEKSESALLHFELGKLLLQASQIDAAKTHFQLAIDHDLLKFRAPSAMNGIIRDIAKNEGVYLVDSEAFFKQRSSNGIVGNELMLEHLHPNLRGYYVISEAFYQAIATNKPGGQWKTISINQAWQQRLVLPSEEYYGFATIQSLKSDYPFVQTPIPLNLPAPSDQTQQFGLAYFNKELDWLNMVKANLDWLNMVKANLDYYTKINEPVMRKKALLILADALPHEPLFNAQAADLLLKEGDKTLANYYRERAKRAGAVL